MKSIMFPGIPLFRWRIFNKLINLEVVYMSFHAIFSKKDHILVIINHVLAKPVQPFPLKLYFGCAFPHGKQDVSLRTLKPEA